MQGSKKELPELLDYVLCLIHLAVFGILGVMSLPAIRIGFLLSDLTQTHATQSFPLCCLI